MILYKYFNIGNIRINSIAKVLEEIPRSNENIKFKTYKINANNSNCFIICETKQENNVNNSSGGIGSGNTITTKQMSSDLPHEEFLMHLNKCPVIDLAKIKDSYIKKLLDITYVFNFQDYEFNDISVEFKQCIKGGMGLKSLLAFYLKLKKNYSKLLDVSNIVLI